LGAALLAGVSLDHLHLGRGELETLAGSVLFAGQILWLERPQFSGKTPCAQAPSCSAPWH